MSFPTLTLTKHLQIVSSVIMPFTREFYKLVGNGHNMLAVGTVCLVSVRVK